MGNAQCNEEQFEIEMEEAVEEGRRQGWFGVLRLAASELGYCEGLGRNEAKVAVKLVELEDTRVALFELCEELGLDAPPNDLHLTDVVRKRIGRAVGAEL